MAAEVTTPSKCMDQSTPISQTNRTPTITFSFLAFFRSQLSKVMGAITTIIQICWQCKPANRGVKRWNIRPSRRFRWILVRYKIVNNKRLTDWRTIRHCNKLRLTPITCSNHCRNHPLNQSTLKYLKTPWNGPWGS